MTLKLIMRDRTVKQVQWGCLVGEVSIEEMKVRRYVDGLPIPT
jgi:hypothetical protein